MADNHQGQGFIIIRSCGLSLLGAVVYHHQELWFIIIRSCDLSLLGAVVYHY